MSNIEAILSAILGAIIGSLFGTFSTMEKNETQLLRFCMTHSISLEQCEIPEKG
jgi:hypothetical protein